MGGLDKFKLERVPGHYCSGTRSMEVRVGEPGLEAGNDWGLNG